MRDQNNSSRKQDTCMMVGMYANSETDNGILVVWGLMVLVPVLAQQIVH